MSVAPADPGQHTLVSLFHARVAADGPKTALYVKCGGKYSALTWDEIAADVARARAALEALGVAAGERVITVSENRYGWIVCDLAILLARAVHVPVHASLTGPQIAYQIADCGARVVVVSGPHQTEKLAGQLGRFDPPLVVASFDECPPLAGREVLRFDTLMEEVARGLVPRPGTTAVPAEAMRTELRTADTAVAPAVAAGLVPAASGGPQGPGLPSGPQGPGLPKPDDLATILYTSGTTGEPKGVMLTHRNLASNALATCEAFVMQPDDLRLTWLPLSHIFARTCDEYAWIAAGTQLALAESRDTVLADCAALRPTVMNGVPYFFEKVARYLIEQGQADQPGRLLELLGGRMRLCCSGGAALPDHVAEFFCRRGVLLIQGYGLTECSPVMTLNTPTRHKHGTVGVPPRGIEVRIAADGEVLTRGPHVMAGYWNKPQATAETVRDGWLHSGDLGSLDADGFLRITGRKKEIIVTSGGKNVAPVLLEALLTEDPLIQQAVVIGDGRSCLSALVVVAAGPLAEELARRDIDVDPTQPQALADERVRGIYEERIAVRLADVSDFEQVRRFTLLAQPFTPERDELTPTLKLRRGVIAKRYAAEIEAMYR